jgi:hypothetical protein
MYHIFDVKKFLLRNVFGYSDMLDYWNGSLNFDGKIVHESKWLFTDTELNYKEKGNKVYSPFDIDYFMNENGYRVDADNYFKSSGETIACFGCSNTLGVGLPWNETWCSLLNSMLGDNYVVKNYGVSGASNSMISRLIYNYLEKETPKAVLCFFPDITRAELLYTSSANTTIFNATRFVLDTLKKEGKFLKTENPEDIVTFIEAYQKIYNDEYGFYDFMRSYRFIESICKLKNVPFYWASWDECLYAMDKSLVDKNFGQNFIILNDISEYHMNHSRARDGYHLGKEFHKNLAFQFSEKFF